MAKSRRKSKQTPPVSPHLRRSSSLLSPDHNHTPFQQHSKPNKLPHRHSALVHTSIRSSPFSKHSQEQNYRGFYNLALLLLFVSNLRLVIENYMKYGFRLSFSNLFLDQNDVFWAICACILMTVSVALMLFSEKCIIPSFQSSKSNKSTTASVKQRNSLLLYFIYSLQILNIVASILIPTLLCWYKMNSPIVGGFVLMASTILFCKSVSYHLVNYELRTIPSNVLSVGKDTGGSTEYKSSHYPEDSSDEFRMLLETEYKDDFYFLEQIPYPKNLTVGNLMYFIFAPTLCYQTTYPRLRKFRRNEFLKRCSEYILATVMMFFVSQQYAVPTLKNSLTAMEDMDFVKLAERVLKLSVVSVFIWLLMFYSFFHSYLNALAELLRFADRRFYKAWWNASNIAEYWRLWNLPVHTWGKRHVYLPLVKNYGIPPALAGVVVFFISALLHELIAGVSTHLLKGWAFWAMFAQVPMIYLTNVFDSIPYKSKHPELFNTIGNLMFWISFTIVGQPTAVILYYTYWYKSHNYN